MGSMKICIINVMSESRSMRFVEQEAVEAESTVKENEIRILRIKLDKESEKMKYLDEKLASMKKYNNPIN